MACHAVFQQDRAAKIYKSVASHDTQIQHARNQGKYSPYQRSVKCM